MKRIALFSLLMVCFPLREGAAQDFPVRNLIGSEVVLEVKRNGVLVCSGIFVIQRKYESLCSDEMRALTDLGGTVSYEIAAAVTFPDGNIKQIRFYKPDFVEGDKNPGCFPGIGRKTDAPKDVEVFFEVSCG